MAKRYLFSLTARDKERLKAARRGGLSNAAEHGLQVLLLLSQGQTVREVTDALLVSEHRVLEVARLFRTGGLESVLGMPSRKVGRPPYPVEKRQEVASLAREVPRLTVLEIARRTGVSRLTVGLWVKAARRA